MRALLRRIGTRTGISLGLIAVIAATLFVAQLVDDDRRPGPFPAAPALSAVATDPLGDDGADDEEPTVFPDDAAVLSVASSFATAWSRANLSAEQWLDGLRPYVTDELLKSLAGVDPSEVPAGATTGEASIRDRSEGHAVVVVPIAPHDSLVLGLVNTGQGWRVSTVDRETG